MWRIWFKLVPGWYQYKADIASTQMRLVLPISEHVSIIQHLSIFSSFLNQLSNFLSRRIQKLEGYKCSLSIQKKGVKQKAEEEDES